MSQLEDSGEIIFRNTERESMSPTGFSPREGNNYTQAHEVSAAISPTPGNINEVIVKTLQNHFAKEFAQLHDRLNGQLVSIHKDFSGKFESMNRKIEVVKGNNPTNSSDLNKYRVHVPIWERVNPSFTSHSLDPQTNV